MCYNYKYDGFGRLLNVSINGESHVTHIYDIAGTLHAHYVYDAWGNHTVVNDTEIGTINPIRYRSYYYDTETKLYYLRARYYDPETGRFISQDNVSYLDPENLTGLNLYAYCNDNPVMHTDSSGNSILVSLLIAATIGAVLGGVYGGVSAAAQGQNIAKGIAVGAIVGAATGVVTELASGVALIAATFAIGFAGDVANQMWVEGKSFAEVNVIQSLWAGTINSVLALPAKGLSVLANQNLGNGATILLGIITNSPLLGLGSISTLITSQFCHKFTINDLYAKIKIG